MSAALSQARNATPSLRPSRQIVVHCRLMKSEAAKRREWRGSSVPVSTSSCAPNSLRFQTRQSTSFGSSPMKIEPVLKPFFRSWRRPSSVTDRPSVQPTSDKAMDDLTHCSFLDDAIDIPEVA